jgi:hypothetical protein
MELDRMYKGLRFDGGYFMVRTVSNSDRKDHKVPQRIHKGHEGLYTITVGSTCGCLLCKRRTL